MSYCVYITTYSGDKLPSKYIGSSSTTRLERGYRGTVSSKRHKSIWRSELMDNPHLFNTNILETFHTRQEATARELELQLAWDVVGSSEWINEGYASPNGYAGRDVAGPLNPRYGKGNDIRKWCRDNPDLVSERNKKAALTQWANPVTREKRVASMQGKKKTIQDYDVFREQQRRKSLISKEKCSIRIEYEGNVYIGWRELYDATGISKHLYNKYYVKGQDPRDRIGKNGPAPQQERR